MDIGKHENAILYFDKVIETEPNNFSAIVNKGIALFSIGKYQEAIPYFDKALEIDPNNAITLNNKGAALEKIGKIHEAFQLFRIAQIIDPNYELAKSNLEKVSLQLGYEPIEGTMQIIVRDQHGNLVANMKNSKLEILNHPYSQNALDNWDFKGIVNRNDQQYEVIQKIHTYYPSKESAFLWYNSRR